MPEKERRANNLTCVTVRWELRLIGFHSQAAPVGVMCRWPHAFVQLVYINYY